MQQAADEEQKHLLGEGSFKKACQGMIQSSGPGVRQSSLKLSPAPPSYVILGMPSVFLCLEFCPLH